MAIKISGLPGGNVITVEGAASEATLQQLVSSINKMTGAKTTPGTSGTTDTGAKGATGAAWEKGLKASADAAGAAVKGTADMFGKAFTNTTPTIKDFSGVLAKYVPESVGATINTFGGVIGDNVEIFRTLSTSGIDLGDSLLQAQLSAAQARLPLEIFARTVKENSQSLSMAFGTASQGAEKFASIQGKFMATSGQKFAALGFSMDELATYNASYMEQLNKSGKLRSMSDAEVAAGAEKYNQELDKMAKATGISRQQLDEANKAQQRDARMRLAMANLTETERTAVNTRIAQLNQMDPSGQLAAGFKDLIASGGVALTKEARNFTMGFASAGVDMGKITRDIANGNKDAVANLDAGMTKMGQAGSQISKGEARIATSMATLGNTTPGLVKAQFAGYQNAAKAVEDAAKEQANKLNSVDPTRGAAGLDQTLTEVQNKFKTSLIESKVLDATAVGMKSAATAAEAAADAFAGMNTTQKLLSVFGAELALAIGGAVTGYLATKGAGKIGEKMQERADNKVLEKEKKAAYDKMSPEDKKKVDALDKSERDNLEKAKKAAKEAADEPGLGKKIASFLKGAGKKAGIAILSIGGVAYVVNEYDIAGGVIDAMVGGGEGEKPPKPLTLEQERQRDRQSVVGAEIPRAVQQPVQPTQPGGNPVEQMSQNVTALKTALKDVDYSNLMFPEAVGTSIDNGVIKLKNLTESIKTSTSAFKDLNNVNLTTLNESINKLSSAVEKQVTTPAGSDNKAASIVPPGAEKEMVALLNQLNMNMGQMVSQQSDAVDYLSKTAKNTRQSLGNLL